MNKFILDMRDVSKELILILEMLKDNNEDSLKKYIEAEYKNIDWKLFLDLLLHHRVYPILASKLQRYDEKLIPQFVIQTVSGFYKRNVFKMLQLSGEMNELAKLFNINGIKAIFLKGPMLGNEIYGDMSLRTCGDLDLLIPIDDLEKMHNLLELKGYIKDDYIQTVLEDWKWRHHHVTYYHSCNNMKIEIHWRLHPGPGKEPLFNELWERKRELKFSNNPIYMLGREDLFLFLVSHGARHGWSRLRWLNDICGMIEQGIDWQKIDTLLKNHNNFHVVGQCIILSSQLLDVAETKETHRYINNQKSKSLAQDAIFYIKKMINLHNDMLPKDVYLYHRKHLYTLMSRQQKVLYILSYLYPYHIDVVTLPLPKKLHSLYFLLRPFLCLWRKARKQELSLEEPK
ncbi:putative nucleotidyltransferase-like protein [Neobacillus bataviensis]|uniref:Putative nucleotidyltransferase-like protein n=2 Tax=Neobacillus bataviensis TaxID=220685 RepID=A0A561D661_9BACI|nr:putative nucleotidyltransferase-like protein [Neobacillus bataviensis]